MRKHRAGSGWFVAEHFGVSEAAVVVGGDVDVVPAVTTTAKLLASAVRGAAGRDLAEFDVDVQQRPRPVVFVALLAAPTGTQQLSSHPVDIGQVRQARTTQHRPVVLAGTTSSPDSSPTPTCSAIRAVTICWASSTDVWRGLVRGRDVRSCTPPGPRRRSARPTCSPSAG